MQVVKGHGAEADVDGWGKNRQKNLCWLNCVLLQSPAAKPSIPACSSPLWRVGFVKAAGGMWGCHVPLWLWDELGLSALCLRASGRRLIRVRGVMAMEDLNLSALLMTLCWHQHGGIPFSLCCFWRRSKSWDFTQNLLKLSHSLGCVEFNSQKWRQWNPRWMLAWGYKRLNLLKFIISSMILWLCWKLWHGCWTEVSSKINKLL